MTSDECEHNWEDREVTLHSDADADPNTEQMPQQCTRCGAVQIKVTYTRPDDEVEFDHEPYFDRMREGAMGVLIVIAVCVVIFAVIVFMTNAAAAHTVYFGSATGTSYLQGEND